MLQRLARRLPTRWLPYRWRELFWQLSQNEPTEVDIHLFSQLEGHHGLVVDVGANRGQFAVSLFAVNQSLNVLSLEPNRELRWILAAIKLLHPRRYRFRLLGAGSRVETLQLHIPNTKHMDLSSNASLVPSEFDKGYVKKRLEEYSKEDQGQYHFRTRNAHIVPLDQLQLQPCVIKIDVEGYELAALQGMEATLTQYHPLLMIEMNNQHQFLPWLAERGYHFYRYIHEQRRLLPLAADQWTLNVFCLHAKTPAKLRALLPLD